MKEIDLLLINPPFHRRNGSGSIFPLGLGYIMANIGRNGFTCAVIDCTQVITSYDTAELTRLEKHLSEKLKEYNPVLVGIGPCITTQVRSLDIIARLCLDRFGEERVFAGGPLASISNQEWFFYERLRIKYIIKGDGEHAVLSAVRHKLENKHLETCDVVSHEGYSFYNIVSDINGLPFPVRPFLDKSVISSRRISKDKITASMITSRGCAYRCRYCVSGNMQARKLQKRSNENIVAEMYSLWHNNNVEDFIFYDDCFFYPSPQLHEDIQLFCDAIIRASIHVTWQMEMRCDCFLQLNIEDFIYLNRAGCRQINLGIEKMSLEALNKLGKLYSVEALKPQICMVHKNSDIKIAGTFILGGSGETPLTVKQMIDESLALGLDYAHYNPLFVYPGTPIYDEMFCDQRAWVEYIVNDNYPWGEIVYTSPNLSREELISLTNYAYQSFYNNEKLESSAMVQDRFNLRRRQDNYDV